MKKLFFLFLAALLLFQACRSAQELYDKGDYEAAYKIASKKLEKYKDTEENTVVIKNALEKILAGQSTYKEQLLKSNDIANRQKVLAINDELINRINWVRVFVPKAFAEEMQQLENETAEIKGGLKEDHIKIGKELLEAARKEGDKSKARAAYEQFKNAKSFHRGLDEELESLITESEELATLVYVVRANQRFALGTRMELDETFKNISAEGDRFTKIYYKPTEEIQNTDCIISIDVGSPKFTENKANASQDFTKTVVTGTETQTNARGESVEVQVTEEVTGTVTQTKHTLNVKSDVQIEIKALNNNCRLAGDVFAHEFKDEVDTYSTKGDLRAIPDEYKNVRRSTHRSQEEYTEVMVQRVYAEVVQRLFKAPQ